MIALLGSRLRQIPSQGRFVQNLVSNRPSPAEAQKHGASTLHPVKDPNTFTIVEKHLNTQPFNSSCG